jgi:Holliday junction resolvase RusA-like endonuclease
MQIVIPGPPVPMMRPRATIRGRHATVYDAQSKIKLQQKKSLSKHVIQMDVNQSDFEALSSLPLNVAIQFHMSVPLSDPMPLKNEKLWGFNLPDKKPDIDNLIKHALDLCNGILWNDDSQVVELHATQRYSQSPCTIIDIIPIKKSMTETTKKVIRVFSPKDISTLQTHLSILKEALEHIEKADMDEKDLRMDGACFELVWFANEYAMKLKKLVTA